jgi:hypothetical protein
MKKEVEKTEIAAMEKTRPEAVEAARLRQEAVLKSPLSVIQMDLSELKAFTSRLQDYLREPGVAAIRICECCINVS